MLDFCEIKAVNIVALDQEQETSVIHIHMRLLAK